MVSAEDVPLFYDYNDLQWPTCCNGAIEPQKLFPAVANRQLVAILDSRQFCASHAPPFAASLILIVEGGPTETPIATRHAGTDFDAMTSTVGAAAKWTIRETKPTLISPLGGMPRSSVQALKRLSGDPAPDSQPGGHLFFKSRNRRRT